MSPSSVKRSSSLESGTLTGTSCQSLELWRLAQVQFRIEVKDISLHDYIQIHHAVYLPHTAGRYAKKQFKKAQMPIVERLVDRYGSTETILQQ
jgi:hypothetical protein